MGAPRIAVVDYGAGNLRSVAKALARSGMAPVVTGSPSLVKDCAGVVLPGVGAFRDAADQLRAAGLDEAVMRAISDRRPYLGLCFGLQLLFDEGEEHGLTKGFGVIAGSVKRFPTTDDLRVPHIGWNEVRFSGSHPMLEYLPARDFFYFVHSYGVRSFPLGQDGAASHEDREKLFLNWAFVWRTKRRKEQEQDFFVQTGPAMEITSRTASRSRHETKRFPGYGGTTSVGLTSPQPPINT